MENKGVQRIQSGYVHCKETEINTACENWYRERTFGKKDSVFVYLESD